MSTSPNLPIHKFHAGSIGCLVYQTIRKEPTASVVGSTSHGFFLLTPLKRVVYISYQSFRSPLTINLVDQTEKLEPIRPGMKTEVSPTAIIISDAEIEIDLGGASSWTPPGPAGSPGTWGECQARLKQVIQKVLSQPTKEIGFGPLLQPLSNPNWGGSLPGELPFVLDKIQNLIELLHTGNSLETLAVFVTLMGLGRGLTPSGDDFIMGLVLALTRWPAFFEEIPGLAEINRRVVEKAYKATTSISANLIESATLGYGDERLMTALDGIVTGCYSIDKCATNLLALGASSGVDALVGITAAFVNP